MSMFSLMGLDGFLSWVDYILTIVHRDALVVCSFDSDCRGTVEVTVISTLTWIILPGVLLTIMDLSLLTFTLLWMLFKMIALFLLVFHYFCGVVENEVCVFVNWLFFRYHIGELLVVYSFALLYMYVFHMHLSYVRFANYFVSSVFIHLIFLRTCHYFHIQHNFGVI